MGNVETKEPAPLDTENCKKNECHCIFHEFDSFEFLHDTEKNTEENVKC